VKNPGHFDDTSRVFYAFKETAKPFASDSIIEGDAYSLGVQKLGYRSPSSLAKQQNEEGVL